MRMPERIWAYERAFEKGEGRWTTECEEVTCTTGVAEYVRADLSVWNTSIYALAETLICELREAEADGSTANLRHIFADTIREALKKQELNQ